MIISFFRPLPVFILSLVLLLQACSGGSSGGGSDRDSNIQSGGNGGQFAYAGPTPASQEIQSFKIAFYDNLVDSDRCGDCHTRGGGGRSEFVDREDVNFAWQQASTLVNLNDPATSAVVQKVAGGHNCWLGTDQAASCAATITAYIERWASGSSESITEVTLLPRVPVSPDGSKAMPATFAAAQSLGVDLTAPTELMGLLGQYCSGCHNNVVANAQAPFFASADPDIAYQALSGKIDLIFAENSRLVRRLSEDSHNCWSDCDANALSMEMAIDNFASQIAVTVVDTNLVISMAQVLETDGIVASSGGRYESDMIAKWEFREGQGSTVADTSGVQPEVPLTLSGDYTWLSSWGVRFANAKAQGGVAGSTKLYELISATGEYTIEAWIAPNNVTQEDAWIAGYAGSANSRNFLFSQTMYNYELYNRSSATDDNGGGMPALATADADEQAQATLQHVVVTFDPVEGRRIYVNGQFTDDVDASGGGLINGWNESFAVVLGNTPGFTFPWAGTMRMVAIYNRKLDDSQILQNFDVGVGQKYFLMFSVAELLNQEGVCHEIEADLSQTNYCYVVYEVSQFDDASYLFDTPFFVNINPDAPSLNFDLKGIKIGVNGKLAVSGQGFVNVDATVDSNLFGPMGQVLSPLGSIIPLENGAETDVFFLAFEDINGVLDTTPDQLPNSFSFALLGQDSSDIAMRTFDEVNQSFSAITGVPSASPLVSAVTGKTIAETYQIIRRQLPGIADFQAFMSSHQMAATQLAAAYCDALVQEDSFRDAIFNPSFNFQAPVAGISAASWRDDIVEPLVDSAIKSGLFTALERIAIRDEILDLITDTSDLKPYIYVAGSYVSSPDGKNDGLVYCDNNATCPLTRTAEVVKASCTAVLASGVVLIQ